METQAYYINKLKENLSHRQKGNPSYSIRAYARDLEMNSSTLSQILNGKRALPVRGSQVIATKLGLDEKESTLFIESINRSYLAIDQIKTAPLDERFMLDESYYKVIAEWEHYAVLDLFELADFENSSEYMARRLKLTSERIDVVLDNLIACGLLIEDERGKFDKAHADVRTTEDIDGEALNAAHFEELELGKRKLLEVAKPLRDFSSSTYAIDPEKLTEAKTIIREFRRKMMTLLKAGEKKEVYMLAIQFFPLTEREDRQDQLH